MFALHATVAVTFIFGYRPRLTAALLWLMTVALHGRQPSLCDVSDQVRPWQRRTESPFLFSWALRSIVHSTTVVHGILTFCIVPLTKLLANLLLWAVFVPLDRTPLTSTHNGIGAAGFVTQLLLVSAGQLFQREAAEDSTWLDGTAMYYVTAGSLDTRAPLAAWFALRPYACRWLTWGMLALDAATAVGLVLTDHTRPMRGILVIAVATVHVFLFTCIVHHPLWAVVWPAGMLILLPTPICDMMWLRRNNTFAPDAAVPHEHDIPESISTESTTIGATSVEGLRRRRPTSGESGVQPDVSSSTSASRSLETPLSSKGRQVVSAIRSLFAAALFAYMLADSLSTDAQMLPSYDQGILGEALGFRQGWRLLRSPGPETRHGWVSVVARLPPTGSADVLAPTALQVDVLAALRTGAWGTNASTAALAHMDSRPKCASCRYPSWRYEHFLHEAALNTFPYASARATQLTFHWCHLLQQYYTSDAGAAAAAAHHVDWRYAAIHTRIGRYTVGPPRAVSPAEPAYGPDRPLLDVVRRC